MKIRILSDLHLEGGHAFPINNDSKADLLVLAGDICTTKSYMMRDSVYKFFESCAELFPHVVYVMGNHELYGITGIEGSEHVRFFKDALAQYPNVHVLENEVVDIEGWRIAGATLWTDFDKGQLVPYAHQMLNDYRWGLKADDVYNWHKESVEFIRGAKADLVVTHHAPHVGSVAPYWKRWGGDTNFLFYTNLNELIREANPQYWIHGHMHDSSHYEVGDTTVICNPKGYGNENRVFNLVKEINV